MAGGLVYIVMYYLPEKIFLSEFKYFAQWLNLARVGVGGVKTGHGSGLKGAALYKKTVGIKGLTH
jgi:hypothetical protein